MRGYEHIKDLGEGGYGKAILVRRRSDKKMCVVKEVRLSALSVKDRQEAAKEANVLKSLRHPNIVEYITSFNERGCFYIVMEYADGGDLAQKIQKRGKRLFSEDEIMHDFIQLALAIKYIHDRKILHRDLKAQNVFLTKDGTVKLGDFGIARVLEHTFQLCRTQIGTPYYLSPEICEGKNYNSKTDIWSLGCILYELCTLKHAFEGGDMNALLMNIIRGNYQPISSQYSADLRNLVASMLTKSMEKRPSINQILRLPFIQQRLSSLLDKTLLEYEFNHTILHGRKPFAAPTVVLSKHEDEDDGADALAPPEPKEKPREREWERASPEPRQAQRSPQPSRPSPQANRQAPQQQNRPPPDPYPYPSNVDPRYARMQARQQGGDPRYQNRDQQARDRARELMEREEEDRKRIEAERQRIMERQKAQEQQDERRRQDYEMRKQREMDEEKRMREKREEMRRKRIEEEDNRRKMEAQKEGKAKD